jgi:general nucleoside transport system permease protein
MENIIANILSPQFIYTILRVSTPLVFAAMAALVVRKSGIMCIAFEAMMLFAALGGVIGSAYTQNLYIGIFAGVLSGVMIAVIFAYFVLVLKSNPVLTGLALNILGSGGTVFAMFVLTGNKGTTSSLRSLRFPVVNIPIIEDIPLIGQIFSGHNALTYLSLFTVLAVYILIYKTTLGLRIRSVGENPHAAESVGVKVIRTKVIALIIGGVIASFGGMYMSMGYLPFFTRDMVSGRGFIGIAAQNLGGGVPIYTLVAALFFGSADAISNVFQTLRIPAEFMQMLPYVVTIIGLMFVGTTNKDSKEKVKKLKEIKGESI